MMEAVKAEEAREFFEEGEDPTHVFAIFEKARATADFATGRAAASELGADYEAEHGPLPAAAQQRARQFLIETGIIDGQPQGDAG